MEQRYTDGSYASQYTDWHASDSPWKCRHLTALLSDELIVRFREIRRLSIAEVGCGACGVIAGIGSFLGERGVQCDLTGYDISPPALAMAAKSHPEVRLRNVDFLTDSARFDLGLMVDFFEHVERPEEFLKAARERFRWILFHVPLDRNLWGRVLRGRAYYDFLVRDRGHLHYYSRRGAFALLRKSGLRPLRWEYTHWGLELPAAPGRSVGVLRLARRCGRVIWPDLSVRVFGGASLAVLTEPARPTRPPTPPSPR